jgi:HD-GYP domain-containing protein (c-di-GMP phosphodiesterase class II)
MVSRKPLLLLTLAEIACLTVGLFVFYGLARSSVEREAENKAREQFAATTGEVLDRLCRASGPDRRSPEAGVEAIRRDFEKLDTPAVALWLVTDSQWAIVGFLRRPTPEDSAGLGLGARLVWSSFNGQDDAGEGQRTGTVIVEGRKHVAVASPLQGRRGYVVALRAVEPIPLMPAALTDSLPAAGLVAWIWTSALLGFVTYLALSKLRDNLSRERAEAEAQALRQIQTLIRTRDALIFGLAGVAESRDEATGRHVERVSFYASRLAMAAGCQSKFRDLVTPEFIRHVAVSSVLHDIGKVGIEDAILFKPGPLTDAERRRMKEHTTIGSRYLADIEQRLGHSPVIRTSREIALRHHERWDGSGYPDGLAGEQIPLAARIVAIADVYEALTSLRDYKPPFPHEKCVEMIRAEAGKHFDPDLVEAFLAVEASFRQIAHQYGEHMFQEAPPAAESGEPLECVGLIAAMRALDDEWTFPSPSSAG